MNFEHYHHESYRIFEEFFFEAIQLGAYDVARRRLDDVKTTIKKDKWNNLDGILKLGEEGKHRIARSYTRESFN